MFSTKTVFYHVPKNAGTSIFEGMKRCPNFRRAHPKINHIRIKEYPPGLFEKPFAIIRHPYERFVSAFYHMNDIADPKHFYHDAPVSDFRTLQDMNIDMGVFRYDPNEFLAAVVNREHPYHQVALAILNRFDIFKSHFYYLQNRFGTAVWPTLKLLRYENLENDFKRFVEERTGCVMEWPQVNKRLSTYNVPLTEESKQILQRLYADDFKHFSFET